MGIKIILIYREVEQNGNGWIKLNMNSRKREETPPSCLTPLHPPYHGLFYPETSLQLLQLIPQERQTYTQELS